MPYSSGRRIQSQCPTHQAYEELKQEAAEEATWGRAQVAYFFFGFLIGT